MFYFFTAYLMCLCNIYLAGKEKALLYIVAFITFAVIALASVFLSKSKAFHCILIVFYTISVCFLIVQHSIYGAQFNDYLLMSIEVAIFIFFSFIEIMKETPSVETGGASF